MTSMQLQRPRRWLALACICGLQQQAHSYHPDETWSLRQRRQQETCLIDGVEFQPGENVGDAFVTRCGPASEWPCFCAPGKNPSVDCPYCSYVDVDEGLVCSKDGDTVEIVNLNGVAQSCTCSVSLDGIPEEFCTESNGDDDDDIPDDDNENNGDFCAIRVADGSIMEFENGESLGDFLPTRCLGGSAQFPCFCNTDLPDLVDCPYCTFLDVNGDLICSERSDSIVYEAEPGELLECACFNDLLSTCKPMAPTLPPVETNPPTAAPVTVIDSPTVEPTVSPTALKTNSPTESSPTSPPPVTTTPAPSTLNPTTPSPTIAETTPTPSTTFDKETVSLGDRTPPQDPALGGCLYLNETTGMVDFVEEGESFGPDTHGPCSPTEEWPVVCNPAIPNGGMEYPYCVFETFLPAATEVSSSARMSDVSNVVCARTEERVTITLPDGSSEECSCLYFNPLLGPSSSCPMVKVDFPASQTAPPTTLPPSSNEPNEGNDGQDSPSAAASFKRIPFAAGIALLLGGSFTLLV